MRECPSCEGTGQFEGEEWCYDCDGIGYDPLSCEQCNEDGVGFNEDGEFLCEDCLFESMIDY